MRQQGLKEEYDAKVRECLDARNDKELHLLPELKMEAKIIRNNWKFMMEIKEMMQDEITS